VRWFEPRPAAPDLDEVLACRYVARSAGHHDLLPDGAMDLVWSAGGGVVLCGPDTRAWSFDMVSERAMAGVRFRPGAAGAVFGVAAAELVDRRVPLADLLGAATERRLVDRLEATARPDAIEGLVRRHLRAVDPVVDLAARVARDPRCNATVLADVSGLSTRQLRRRFDRAVGYGPAFYARVARLQRFATSALRWPERGLAELAASAGYTDQSHLGRDTREIAGRTPTELAVTLTGSSIDVRSVPDKTPAVTRRWAA
jgi:AraC-like DNA-binding protein